MLLREAAVGSSEDPVLVEDGRTTGVTITDVVQRDNVGELALISVDPIDNATCTWVARPICRKEGSGWGRDA